MKTRSRMILLLILIGSFSFAKNNLTSLSLDHHQIPMQISEDKNWNLLINTIAKNGKILSVDNLNYLYLENIVKSPNSENHTANYISIVGYMDTDGNYKASHLEVVSESWVLENDGRWYINQWLHKISGKNEIMWSAHVNLIEDQDRRVYKHEYLKETEEMYAKNWKKTLNSWYQFISQFQLPN